MAEAALVHCARLGWSCCRRRGRGHRHSSDSTGGRLDCPGQSAFFLFPPRSSEEARNKTKAHILMKDYMGGGAHARQLVNEFLQSQGKSVVKAERKV